RHRGLCTGGRVLEGHARMRPRFPTWRGEDKAGEALVVRVADRRDAAQFIAHTRQLVTETDFMLKGGTDALPGIPEQRLILDYFASAPNSLCIVAARPSRPLGRAPILGSLTLTPGRTGRTQHTVQLGMGVLRTAWGLGLGGRLLDGALTWARANPILSRVSLQVYEDNEAARQLYLTRGFVDEGVMVDEVRLEGRWMALVGMSYDTTRGET
ncbi:MAG: GNAT family N-acetyltransferase, partial [Myxococcota bacterium]|nr:GNAT family N-acetyltransferase [Myxococcota bacterium]